MRLNRVSYSERKGQKLKTHLLRAQDKAALSRESAPTFTVAYVVPGSFMRPRTGQCFQLGIKIIY